MCRHDCRAYRDGDRCSRFAVYSAPCLHTSHTLIQFIVPYFRRFFKTHKRFSRTSRKINGPAELNLPVRIQYRADCPQLLIDLSQKRTVSSISPSGDGIFTVSPSGRISAAAAFETASFIFLPSGCLNLIFMAGIFFLEGTFICA